jgi:hypothetical protein
MIVCLRTSGEAWILLVACLTDEVQKPKAARSSITTYGGCRETPVPHSYCFHLCRKSRAARELAMCYGSLMTFFSPCSSWYSCGQ